MHTYTSNPSLHILSLPLPPPKGVQFTLLHGVLNISEYRHKQTRLWGGKGWVFTHRLFWRLFPAKPWNGILCCAKLSPSVWVCYRVCILMWAYSLGFLTSKPATVPRRFHIQMSKLQFNTELGILNHRHMMLISLDCHVLTPPLYPDCICWLSNNNDL